MPGQIPCYNDHCCDCVKKKACEDDSEKGCMVRVIYLEIVVVLSGKVEQRTCRGGVSANGVVVNWHRTVRGK